MSDSIAARVAALGWVLPKPVVPVASYVPWVKAGNLLFVAGQVTKDAEGVERYIGKLGDPFGVEEGQAAARLCALNVLAQLDAAVGGDIARVKQCVRVGGFVNAVPSFTQHPAVLNGASDLVVAVFGDAGRHARASVGVSSLPRNVAVEVEATFLIE